MRGGSSRSSTLQLIPGVRTARMLRTSRSRGALHEAFLKRSGMRRLRVVPRKHTSGRLGSPSAATTSGCHVMAGRGQAQGGESRRMRAYARGLARKRGPLAQNRREWSVERRFRGCCSPSHGEYAAAPLPRRAFRRSAPLIARGENPSTNSRRGARIICRGCLTFDESGNRCAGRTAEPIPHPCATPAPTPRHCGCPLPKTVW